MSVIEKAVHVSFDPAVTLATIRIEGQSTPITAKVLGLDHDIQGIKRAYLASRVHDELIDTTGWLLTGAISTILTRVDPPKDDKRSEARVK